MSRAKRRGVLLPLAFIAAGLALASTAYACTVVAGMQGQVTPDVGVAGSPTPVVFTGNDDTCGDYTAAACPTTAKLWYKYAQAWTPPNAGQAQALANDPLFHQAICGRNGTTYTTTKLDPTNSVTITGTGPVANTNKNPIVVEGSGTMPALAQGMYDVCVDPDVGQLGSDGSKLADGGLAKHIWNYFVVD